MKKIALILALVLSFALITAGCGKETSSKTNQKVESSTANPIQNVTASNDFTDMVFVKLPSPPNCKKISDKVTAKKVLDFIDSAEKTPIENRHELGWVMLINVTTSDGLKQYSVCGTTLTIGDECFKVSQKFVDDLEKLYDEIDVQEEKYIK